jgi:hypothetical protein
MRGQSQTTTRHEIGLVERNGLILWKYVHILIMDAWMERQTDEQIEIDISNRWSSQLQATATLPLSAGQQSA